MKLALLIFLYYGELVKNNIDNNSHVKMDYTDIKKKSVHMRKRLFCSPCRTNRIDPLGDYT